MPNIDLKSMTYEELEAYLKGKGQPRFRAGQLFGWMHQKQAASFDEMTNLPKSLLAELGQEGFLTRLTVEKKLVSALDGTAKYLYALPAGEHEETVGMRYEQGLSICLSTLV